MDIDKSLMEEAKSINFPCIKILQPIGEFYCGAIDSKDLTDVTWVDVRRIEQEREFETYLGIQRPLNKKRVEALQDYVTTVDACFPSAVILAVNSQCAIFDDKKNVMTLSNIIDQVDSSKSVIFGKVAKVLDGQHRIEGLRDYRGPSFQVNVSIFVDIDIAEQAYIFSTVNLAQTKVNKSLVYDLFELAETRSPQKLAHNIAVALDGNKQSPLYKKIKRLGSATPGRYDETITQATFVESLLRYISAEPDKDRDIYKRGKKPVEVEADESKKFIFRNMMIREKDIEITDVLYNYFEAVQERWPTAWNSTGQGMILNKTNGFRALMRFLRPAYLYLCSPGKVPTKNDFLKVFNKVSFDNDHFNINNFKPGTSGESELYKAFVNESGLSDMKT